MTRQELRDQVEHDQFTDSVSNVVSYASSHRSQLIGWAAIVAGIAVIAGLIFWYTSSQNAARERDLDAAFSVLNARVGAADPNDPSAKTYATQDAKTKASMKVLSDLIAKDGGTRQGLVAQYYRGTLKAQSGDTAGAEADLNAVSNSSNSCAPLAKIALAQLYSGENKSSEAQSLLRDIVNKPSDLVSKAQAQLLLAQMELTTNPQDARKILQSLKAPGQDPAVGRAADELSAQLK